MNAEREAIVRAPHGERHVEALRELSREMVQSGRYASVADAAKTLSAALRADPVRDLAVLFDACGRAHAAVMRRRRGPWKKNTRRYGRG